MTNPQILAAAFNEEAAIASIGVRKADLLPRLGFQAQYSVAAEPSSISAWIPKQGSVGGVLSNSALRWGLSTYSRIREAKQTASQRRLEVLDARIGRYAKQVVRSLAPAEGGSRHHPGSVRMPWHRTACCPWTA
jgi:outer membrane protein TolC